MGKAVLLTAAVIAVLAAWVFWKSRELFEIPPVPKFEANYWGPGESTADDDSIAPFKIKVSDEVLKDLRQRLDSALPFQKPLENSKQHYGINGNLLKDIVDFWKTKYEWRERELFLNQYPQFKVKVQGLNLHYLHVKPKSTKNLKVLPLLLIHGWPGSVREFYEMIPILTTPQNGRDYVFEVIAPSLPGYGFSDAASKPGLGAVQMSVLFRNFMKKIGFKNFYIQGGDWGGIIVQNMAILYPDEVLGVHSNMCFVNTPLSNIKTFIASFYPSYFMEKHFEEKLYPIGKMLADKFLETGYMHLQATKPDTAGAALRDSPVGLAAYILEKFTTWTNPAWKDLDDGGLLKKYTMTQLLDNVMIYWVTRSMTTSMRLYAESFNKAQYNLNMQSMPVKVYSACARFSYELVYQPDFILKLKYDNLLQTSDYTGGHFAAFEAPEVLAKDIYDFVEKTEKLVKKQ